MAIADFLQSLGEKYLSEEYVSKEYILNFLKNGGAVIAVAAAGPLAKFPGPKLAAMTGWYETYYDCFKKGRYWVEIEKMHQKYGPIVRISPWELHVNDPDWNEPYKVSSRVNKYHWYYTHINSSDSAFGTADHDLHRIRRKAQQSYFSQDSVAQFDPVLAEIQAKFCARLEEFRGTGEPVNLANAFRSLATDVVTEFAFHKSYNLLDYPDFAAGFQRAVRDFPEIGMWHRHFGLVLDVLQSMPRWLIKLINPSGIGVVDFFNDISSGTNAIVAEYNSNTVKKSKPNVIHRMLDSPDLPAKEKASWRLELEARTFVGAGTETTGNTLSATTFYLLQHPDKVARLKEEVTAAQNQSPTRLRYHDLQQLPYLSAVVLEGLRISSSLSGRLPRVNTREALKYKNYTIPVGTPVSTTQKLTSDNPKIFPEPRSFVPERWLTSPAERKQLEKYLQGFGRGSRACLGIYLAYSELYVTLAELFGNFDMELFDTEESDISQYHDYFSPFPNSDKGLRVTIK
ncbi:cytochrome P450 [Xylogone sp. PMI_703]|nr:cytochrome P450 [Xylogone sp. PMI_703]